MRATDGVAPLGQQSANATAANVANLLRRSTGLRRFAVLYPQARVIRRDLSLTTGLADVAVAEYLARWEGQITWLVQPDRYLFVRERFSPQASPTDEPELDIPGSSLLGYSCLHAAAPRYRGEFLRRLFWRRDSDDKLSPSGYMPIEMVKTTSLAPGALGVAYQPEATDADI